MLLLLYRESPSILSHFLSLSLPLSLSPSFSLCLCFCLYLSGCLFVSLSLSPSLYLSLVCFLPLYTLVPKTPVRLSVSRGLTDDDGLCWKEEEGRCCLFRARSSVGRSVGRTDRWLPPRIECYVSTGEL